MVRQSACCLGLWILLAGSSVGAAPGTFEEAMESGQAALSAWKIAEARQAFDAALRLAQKPVERARARLHYGHTFYYAGRYDEARGVYAEVIQAARASRDERFYAHQFTGHCHLQEQDVPQALKSYRLSLPARPTLARNARNDILFAYLDQVNVGRRLFRRGMYGQAEKVLEQALSMAELPTRERSAVRLLLGQCRLNCADLDRARVEYEKVLSLKPVVANYWHQSEALAGLAYSFEQQGKEELARSAWLRLWNMDGAHPNLRAKAADRLRAMGADLPKRVSGLAGQYGANCNPTGSPIGGGTGYARIPQSGDYAVATIDELGKALDQVTGLALEERDGKVIYLKPGSEIELAGRTGFTVPSGVTLAGNRGQDGAPGPLLYTSTPFLGHAVLVARRGARITGLRLRGDAAPFKELFGMWPYAYWTPDFYKTSGRSRPRVTAVWCNDGVEADNCEVSCFQSAFSCYGADIYVHHNHVHDVHAYPVVVGRGGRAPLIEANLIDWAWHGVATADDMSAGFEVRYNIFREAAPNLWGQGISGQFAVDHHGQGERFLIHHNTFLHLDRQEGVPNRAICLAPPWDLAEIRNNWFKDYMTADEATYWVYQKPAKLMTDLKEIVTRRDLSPYLAEYLKGIEDFERFDMREIVAMTRGRGGGQNLWIYNNAYGPDRDVVACTLFTTPRITLIEPDHRRVRTRLGRGRGGVTHPPLHHLRGKIPIDIAVEVLHGLTLAKVTIDLVIPNVSRLYAGGVYVPRPSELRRLYEGSNAPSPGKVVLDTPTLPNGVYGLLVTAEDSRGIRDDHRTFFEIVNPKAR